MVGTANIYDTLPPDQFVGPSTGMQGVACAACATISVVAVCVSLVVIAWPHTATVEATVVPTSMLVNPDPVVCAIGLEGRSCSPIFRSPSTFINEIIRDTGDPCTGFMDYACGQFLDSAPPRADRTFGYMMQTTAEDMADIMRLESERRWDRGPLHLFYTSCLAAYNGTDTVGDTAMEALFGAAGAVTLADLARTWGRLHAKGMQGLVEIRIERNPLNATMPVYYVEQGGLLGISSYDVTYRTRAATEHYDLLTRLVGEGATQDVKAIEASFAEIHTGSYAADYVHYVNSGEAAEDVMAYESFMDLTAFNMRAYFAELPGIKSELDMWVYKPYFFYRLASVINRHTLSQWRSYLQAVVLMGSHWALPGRSFARIRASPHTHELGLRSREPWLRTKESQRRNAAMVGQAGLDNVCSQMTEWILAEKVGSWYTDYTITAEDVAQVNTMVAELLEAFTDRVKAITWLSETSKNRTIDKLQFIRKYVAVPPHGNAYAPPVLGSSYYVNVLQAREWAMSMRLDPNLQGFVFPTTTVNAYYSPAEQTINIMAAIMRVPLFGADYDRASRYAGLGMVVAHELAHALDADNIAFNEYGNVENWMDAASRAHLDAQYNCLSDLYTDTTLLGNRHNGARTLGENVADQLGVQLAYVAARLESVEEKKAFFVSFAQSWCTKLTPSQELSVINGDVHSVPQFRIDKTLYNFNEFRQVYNCPDPDRVCAVWE